MPSWPGTLPDKVLKDGYDEMFSDNVVRTPMDVGPPKIRRRATSAPKIFTVNQMLTSAQVGYLDTFYYTTLYHGSLSFDWKHPRTAVAASVMRFRSPPRVTTAGGDRFIATYELEIL